MSAANLGHLQEMAQRSELTPDALEANLAELSCSFDRKLKETGQYLEHVQTFLGRLALDLGEIRQMMDSIVDLKNAQGRPS